MEVSVSYAPRSYAASATLVVQLCTTTSCNNDLRVIEIWSSAKWYPIQTIRTCRTNGLVRGHYCEENRGRKRRTGQRSLQRNLPGRESSSNVCSKLGLHHLSSIRNLHCRTIKTKNRWQIARKRRATTAKEKAKVTYSTNRCGGERVSLTGAGNSSGDDDNNSRGNNIRMKKKKALLYICTRPEKSRNAGFLTHQTDTVLEKYIDSSIFKHRGTNSGIFVYTHGTHTKNVRQMRFANWI